MPSHHHPQEQCIVRIFVSSAVKWLKSSAMAQPSTITMVRYNVHQRLILQQWVTALEQDSNTTTTHLNSSSSHGIYERLLNNESIIVNIYLLIAARNDNIK